MHAPLPTRLHTADTSLTVDASLGGSALSFIYKGRNILRPALLNTRDALETSHFPLVPIVNRIPEGRFSYDGKDVILTPNFGDNPDFLHGHGWRNAWRTIEQSDDKLILKLIHHADEWPWDYQATQNFCLSESSLTITLSVINTADSPMPAGLGFHPYFPVTAATRLTFKFTGHWAADALCHPTHSVDGPFRADFREGAYLIDSIETDHTFYDFGGEAILTESGQPDITVTASPNCNKLHLYLPVEGGFTCLEPVTDRADPFGQLPREIKILQPGEYFEVWMNIAIG